MRFVLPFALLAGLSVLRVAAGQPTSLTSITVLFDFDQVHSQASFEAMKMELRTLMGNTGIAVEPQLKSELRDHAVFPRLVLFKMKGACTMNALPIGALSDERGPLAMTYTSNGQLLPFGEVECDRVRESLQRTLGRGNPEAKQSAYGTALGRVVAHEMYHMIAGSKLHTKTGLTKESLSSQELLARRSFFSREADTAVRHSSSH